MFCLLPLHGMNGCLLCNALQQIMKMSVTAENKWWVHCWNSYVCVRNKTAERHHLHEYWTSWTLLYLNANVIVAATILCIRMQMVFSVDGELFVLGLNGTLKMPNPDFVSCLCNAHTCKPHSVRWAYTFLLSV